MFKVLHVAAKRHLLRMGREVGGGSREQGAGGSLGAIVTQTSGGKYLFVQQEETCAQGRGRNQFSNGNWFRFEAWHRQQGSTYQALGSPPYPPSLYTTSLCPFQQYTHISCDKFANRQEREQYECVCVWGGELCLGTRQVDLSSELWLHVCHSIYGSMSLLTKSAHKQDFLPRF